MNLPFRSIVAEFCFDPLVILHLSPLLPLALPPKQRSVTFIVVLAIWILYVVWLKAPSHILGRVVSISSGRKCFPLQSALCMAMDHGPRMRLNPTMSKRVGEASFLQSIGVLEDFDVMRFYFVVCDDWKFEMQIVAPHQVTSHGPP